MKTDARSCGSPIGSGEENIKNFQMETAKLTAAIDSSKDQIAALDDVSQSLQTQASEATDSSEKIYSKKFTNLQHSQ